MHPLKRVFLALFLASTGMAYSQCTLVKNEPQYGYTTLPGSTRYLTVHQTGCPSASVSHLVMTGDISHATVTFTVPDATIFTVGKKVETKGFTSYPFDEILEGATMTVLSASGTTVTTEYDNAEFLLGDSDVTGVTLTQISPVNWNTSAGTLTCTSNCEPLVEITTDSAAGNITTVEPYTPYPTGGYRLTSTHQITVTATAVDNPSSSVSYVLNQAAKRTQVIIMGAQYTQAFEGQTKQLWAGILGNTNQGLTWSITTQPAGGDGSLVGTTKRNVLFAATVPGRYKITATSADDGTASDYEIIDVLPQAMPSWASAPPDKAAPEACGMPSAFTGHLYEVGPTHTYPTLNDAMTALKIDGLPGSTVMIYNEDTTGSSPTTYAEYTEVQGINTPDQPINICGIPDSTGHVPVLTGENAHGPSWFKPGLYSLGIIVTYPIAGCYGESVSAGSCGPTHVRIAGIKVINANPSYTFYQVDGTTTQSWGGNGFDIRTGAHITIEGDHCYSTSQCVGTYANENGAYAALSQSILWQESYTGQNGISGNAGSHPAYMQSLNGNVIDRVYIDTGVSGDQGSCIKMRGQMNVVSGSYCAPGFARGIDLIEAQDDPSYINFINLLVSGGFYNTSDGTFDLNLEAARQESMFKDYAFGDLLLSSNNHYSHDHDDNIGDIGMNARYGQLFLWYDTFPEPVPLVDTHNQYNLNYFLNQKINIANSIIWNSLGNWTVNDFAMTAFHVQTSLFNSGTFSNATPIWGIGYGATGWSRQTQANTAGFDRPLDTRITGNLSTDFITASVTPYDGAYFPQAGSAAIGSATTISGDMANFAVNYQSTTIPGVYARRSDLTTLGAMDSPPATSNSRIFGSFGVFGIGLTH